MVIRFSMISLDKPKQSQGPPETHHNSPQLTTKPEHCFNPQPSGPSTPLDFPPAQRRVLAKAGGKIRASGQRKKPHPRKDGASRICRRSPNLPHTYACSTIGPTRLNFRVRDGNGCDPRSKLTGKLLKFRSRDLPQLNRLSRHLPKTY